MNYAQLQARAAALCKLEGWTDVSPAPDWASLIQRGWDQFAWDSECFVSTETVSSVNGQAEYPLTGTYKAVLDVTFNAVGLLRSEERFERNLNPNWRTQTAGTPLRWVLARFSTVALVPPPSTVATVAVRGITYGTAFAAQTDTPAIPSHFHEAIALKAACFHGEIYAQGESRARLALLDAAYTKYVNDCRESLLEGYARREEAEGGSQ